MKAVARFLGFAAKALLVSSGGLRAAEPVIVHEWGTFTSLQDEDGQAIGGINTDDEPVPDFVYVSGFDDVVSHYSGFGNFENFGLPPYDPFGGKAGPLPSCDPSVTMRLETPVLYIYPPKGQSPQSVPALDVHVVFHGGFLTQFYPYADSTSFVGQNKITEKSVSSLDWKDVRIGSTGTPVETSDKVWTTPREVSAPLLEARVPVFNSVRRPEGTEAEHFLFYRGVAHLDSPIFLTRQAFNVDQKDWLYVWPSWIDKASSQSTPISLIALDATYPAGWLVDIHQDGTCAFQSISSFTEGARTRVHPLANFSSHFEPSGFTAGNLAKLKASMQAALIKEGLYPDEATAMLKTWELSYFKSPGLRFFYIVPRAWTDKVLPLKITGAPTEITRVMIGRIELVTGAQELALQRLAAGPCPDLPAFKRAAQVALQSGRWSKADTSAFSRGEKPLSELGIPIPPLIQDYLSLGRFRDALVIREYQRRPSLAIAQFINDNRIAPPGMEVKGRDALPLSPDVTLKNPGIPSASVLHL